MTKSLAIAAIIFATCCIAVAYASAFVPDGPRWGAWCMVLGLATMIVALMALGATRRRGSVGRLAIPFAFTFLVIVGCFGSALALPADLASARLILGLPWRAALVIYGVGLLPMLILPLAYALTFEALTLSEADLAQVRALGAQYAAKAGEEIEP